jgi:hypothetical protein
MTRRASSIRQATFGESRSDSRNRRQTGPSSDDLVINSARIGRPKAN